MPTIDQLAPATAAADTDELLVSQNGTARKITRAQVLAGTQPAIAMPAGTLLGRVSAGIGSPETITIGSNLSLNGSTLVAAATPFSVSLLPAGTVPALTDSVPLSQGGANTSITYGQFMSGLAGVPNVNASQALVTPTGSTSSIKLADVAASILPVTGGAMTGPLLLSGNPTIATQAANKQYVDTVAVGTGVINVKAPPYNAQLNGVNDDTAAFKAAYSAAPAGSVIYVPFGVALIQKPNTWGISLTKRVKWIVDGTTFVDGTPLASAIPTGTNPAIITLPGIVVGNSALGAEISLAGSQPTDLAVLHSSYIVDHNGGNSGSVIANARTDTLIYNSPNDYVWGGLDRLIWTGVQTPTAATPAQHVGRYIQSIRQTIGRNANGVPLPQPQLWAACLEMRDTTGQPSSMSNATLTVEMDFIGNGLDDANNRQIQSLVVQQHDTTGAPVEVGTVIGVYLAAGSTGHAKNVFGIGIPFSRSVLDTTNATQMAGAAAIRLAAGHTIAFESSGSNSLSYDSVTGTLRWNQGSLSYAVGKGITVGWQYVAAGNVTLPNYIAGDLVFLVGGGAYTVTLPAANTVAAGVGFTFSNIGAAVVTISPTGADIIDNGPIILRSNDRYHIVSDGLGSWREIFRTNSVSPRFTGPPVLPSYTVAGLPAAPGAGAKAFATNGRKPADSAGSGTGVEVFYDGSRWICGCSGTQVTA